ncbi:MAG TPA: hypothetical protein VN026_11490 [Bacteroidia bacterium]|jgi:hypothetical protein|nr:hypothetical protein [Bacteroidia bacterium]
MPTIIYKTLYACNKCKNEYPNEYNASMCENLQTLETTENLKEFNVGDELNFNNEESLGSRWSYSSGSGKIVSKELVRNNDKHQYLYWVNGGEGALWVKDDYGWKMFSPAELKKRSFAY